MKELIAEYQKKFEPLLNKKVAIKVGSNEIETVILEVKKGVQKDMKNVPEKRLNGLGRYSTPLCLCVVCTDGTLYFVLDRIKSVTVGMSGTRIAMDSYVVNLEYR